MRVANADEAAQAAAAKLELIEVVIGGSDDLQRMRAIRAAFPGRLRVTADHAAALPDLLHAARATRADEVALPVDLMPLPTSAAFERGAGVAIVARLNTTSETPAVIASLHGRVDAVMLEGARDALDGAGIARLAKFAEACRANNILFGLSGGLEAPDVARLLLLAPDVLGFDDSLRADHHPSGQLDNAALHALAALISGPHHPQLPSGSAIQEVVDRIFVRDFIVLLSIGAYRAEHGDRQRVRFDVEAEIRRMPVAPHDMRDVFSYDIIIETIRVLAQRPHVAFVETLAEEVAQALLAHPAVVSTTISVAKLDVVDGTVGIEIHRRALS